MKDEIKINKANKSLTFINNGIAFSQFGIADEILDYITNLQQAIEVKNERIKEEQQEKERYIKFYNELNVWNKKLQQENERLKEEYKNKLDKTLEVLQYELQFQTGGCYHRLSNLFDYLQNGSDDNE